MLRFGPIRGRPRRPVPSARFPHGHDGDFSDQAEAVPNNGNSGPANSDGACAAWSALVRILRGGSSILANVDSVAAKTIKKGKDSSKLAEPVAPTHVVKLGPVAKSRIREGDF